MNSVFLSPHFPSNFYNFAVQLKAAGATVLGLADEPYESLRQELRDSLTDYYRVDNMHDYDQLVRALGYFTHKYGKIDHIDSHNEYWLETEAKLRTDFNIQGIRLNDIAKIKRKSEMKKVFLQAGLKPARGQVCRTEEELLAYIEQIGYPVVAKPDIGVGAIKTFKLSDKRDLQHYLAEKPAVDYIVEEFISAPIVTFDGLTDREGKVIFCSSLTYNRGVMETVNDDTDMYYSMTPNMAPEIEEVGRSLLQAFDVRARFFHFEFFLTDKGEIIPLEVNIRPPGGLTLDMFNFMFDFDCYKLWADMLVNEISAKVGRPERCVAWIGRKDHFQYALSHDEVFQEFGPLIVHFERLNPIFAGALGNVGYIVCEKTCDPLNKAAATIQKLKA